MSDTITIVGGGEASGSGGKIVGLDALYLTLGIDTETVTLIERSLAEQAIRSAEAAITRHLQYDPAYSTETEYYPLFENRPNSGIGLWEISGGTAYLERYSGTDTENLQLRRLPVREQDADGQKIQVFVDYDGRSGSRTGSFAAETEWTFGEDFWPTFDSIDSSSRKVCNDGLLKSHRGWPEQAGSVKVIYTAGYTEDEFEGTDAQIDASVIYQCAIDEAQQRFKYAWSHRKGIAGHITAGITSERTGDYSYTMNQSVVNQLFAAKGALSARSQALLETYVNYGAHLDL